MKKRKDKLMSIYLMFGLILLVIGFSYAFFIYNKTGLYTHTITGGKMKVIYDETTGNNITIENAYPRTDEEAKTKSLEFEFTITGYNESDKNVYYAIEMDHGSDITGKNRFLDSDMKLTLYENEEIVFENEIFNNLDNQDIYYNYFKSGTSSQNPIINNYKMRIWINDHVYISDTIENDISLWDDNDWNWIEELYGSSDATDEALWNACGDNDTCYLSDLGMNVYTSDEFANSYANFKVNVHADLSYDNVGYLTYDANGGINTPKKTSVLTGMVTRSRPYKITTVNGKTIYSACMGWSGDPNAEVPEYKPGDYYNGEGELLYAVYSSDINVMNGLGNFDTYKPQITEVYFINETEENIDTRYNASSIKYDLTYNNQGRVLGWLENDYYDDTTSKQYYKLYIGSEGTTYLSTGKNLFTSTTYGKYFSNMTYISLENVSTSLVTDMSNMFNECSALVKLDLSNFDTSNITNMYNMFGWCSKLTELDLSNFDTSNVINISAMFSWCSKLTELDLSNFNTSNVTTMSQMFWYCSSLTELDVSNFNTSNVTSMTYMFYSCSGLTKLDTSNFDTSNVTAMSGMFLGCGGLIELNLNNFDTSNVTDMSYMFSHCSSLTTLNLSNFDTSNVTNMSSMFSRCLRLTELDLSNFDTSNVTNMSSMFYYCEGLTELDLISFDTSNVKNMSLMFACSDLTKLDISSFDTGNVTNMEGMFDECRDLIELDVSNFSTSQVTDMSSMFWRCWSLTELDVSSFDTSNVTDMSEMFYECGGLIELDLSNFDTSKVTDMSSMFENCSKLKTIYANTDWNNGTVTSSDSMFSSCTSLVGAISYNSSNVTIDYANPTTGYFTLKSV